MRASPLDLMRLAFTMSAEEARQSGRMLDVEGSAVCVVPSRPASSANRALLGRADERVIGEIARCFREADVVGRVELLPGSGESDARRALLRHGFTRAAVCVVNAGLPAAARKATPDVTVVDAPDQDRARLEEAVRIYADGYAFPEASRPQLMDGLRDLFGKSGWQMHVARVNGALGGMAVSYAAEGALFLACATTLPELRRRGVQGALLDFRLARAAELGCRVVFGRTVEGSQSDANMRRAGLARVTSYEVWVLDGSRGRT